MEKNFRASPEFRKLKFFRVKNARLADPYERSQFPAGLEWLAERYAGGEFKRPSIRPSWWVFVDRQRVATFGGTKQWESTAIPRIKQIVADNH